MPQGSPLNEIFQMRGQGLSNNQIIQNLQREGYTNTQVFDAMNQADTKMAVEGQSMPMQQMSDPNLFVQPPQQISNPPQPGHPGQGMPPSPQGSGMGQQQNQNMFQSNVKVEELVEAIVEEKWVELIKDVNKIVDWKNRVESRISDMEATLTNLKENFSDLNKAVLGKVGEYDKHILEIGSDIKAMEKVFSKVLPTFTENVNELSRIADKFGGRPSRENDSENMNFKNSIEDKMMR